VFLLIDLSYAASVHGIDVSDCFLNPVKHAQALESCLLRHPDIDGLSIKNSSNRKTKTSIVQDDYVKIIRIERRKLCV